MGRKEHLEEWWQEEVEIKGVGKEGMAWWMKGWNKWLKGMLAQYLWISLNWPHFGRFSLSEKTISFSSHCFYSYILSLFHSQLLLLSQTVKISLTTSLSFLHPRNNAIILPTVYHILFSFFFMFTPSPFLHPFLHPIDIKTT